MEPTFMMSLKIYWSLLWRTSLATFITAIAFMLAGLAIYFMMFGFHSMQDIMHQGAGNAMEGGFVIAMIFFVVAFIVLTFYIYRWALNCLPELNYKEGSVILMKHSMPVERFGLFDSICVGWSMGWRAAVLMITYLVVFMVIAYFLHPDMSLENAASELAGPLLTIVNQVIEILIAVLAMYWMLARKKEGRWLSLEARHEGM